MTRAIYVWREGKFVDVTKAAAQPKKGRLQIITDEMPETWNPVDGKHYTSKAKMRAVAKANGLEEVGNDVIQQREPEYQSIREDFERAEYQVRNRR